MTDEKDNVLAKVAKLLAKAEATPYDQEADAFREKADELMTVYAIQQWEVDAKRKPEERTRPESRTIHIADRGSEISDLLVELFGVLVAHKGAKVVYSGLIGKVGQFDITARAVAYPADLDYIEMLFNSLRLYIGVHMAPRYDDVLSFEENVARCKEAGMKRIDAHRILQPDVPWERRHGVRYTGIYTKFCERTGRERTYTAPHVFQRNFIGGFISRISLRLRDIRQHQAAQGGVAEKGSGAELVLLDRNQMVTQMFEDMFPDLKHVNYHKNGKSDLHAQGQGSEAARNADLGQGRMGNGPKELG